MGEVHAQGRSAGIGAQVNRAQCFTGMYSGEWDRVASRSNGIADHLVILRETVLVPDSKLHLSEHEILHLCELVRVLFAILCNQHRKWAAVPQSRAAC